MSSPLHSCEICGTDGFTDEGLQTHIYSKHLEGVAACPFCDLSEVTPKEMLIHVNCAHLDYLTPDREAVSFIDDEDDDEEEDEDNDKVNCRQGNLGPPTLKKRGKSSENSIPARCSSPMNRGVHHGLGSPLRSNLALRLENKATPVAPLKLLQCPLCAYSNLSAHELEEHVNRQHLDLMSPGVTMQGQGPTSDNQHDKFACPLCVRKMSSAEELELHVNLDHRDILSPQKALGSGSPRTNGATHGEGCPFCKMSGFASDRDLALHLEQHFLQYDTSDVASDQLLAGAVDQEERAFRRKQEEREFELLKAQYGMDNQGNFREQSARNMQKAVFSGELTVADYYEKQVGLRLAETHGVDDGTSCTKNIISKLSTLSSMSGCVVRSYVCSAVDHYGCTYGDKGWGCGYRNAQMMLSSLLQHTGYNQVLEQALREPGGRTERNSNQYFVIPSISRLQKLIEWAWSLGFDPQGCDQLGGQLHNSRKWIGTTEMKTLLSSMRIRTELVDFHRPTGADGSHPELFNWVLQYFQKKDDFKPPLYLQHQGHSRTIVGAEVLRNGVNLLVVDPSHTSNQMAQFNDTRNGTTAMRLIRKSSGAMRARQYQLLSVCGIMQSEQEYQESKIFRSTRIPHD